MSTVSDRAPIMNVEDDKPVLIVNETDAEFGDTDTLVNDTIMTVNGTSLVGGSDILSG